MLTGGRAPVEGDSVEQVWHRKLNEDPTPLRDHRGEITGDLEALVMSCLAREPADRPASMTAFKTSLVAALERVRAMESGLLPVKAPSETAVVSRLRWPRVALGGAALVAVLVVALLWRTSAPPPPPQVIAATVEPPPRPVAITTQPLPLAAPPVPLLKAPRPAERPASPPPLPSVRKAPAPVPKAAPAPDPQVEQHLKLGEEKFQNGDFNQAIFEAKAALRLGAGARAHLLMGKAHLEMEEPDEAATAYARALEVEPGNAAARAGLDRARKALASSK